MDSATFLNRVCDLTGFDRDRSERVVRATLVTLGTRIDPGEADDLAAQLPEALAACLRHEGEAERFTAAEFRRRVARIVPLDNEQARDGVAVVFAVLADAVSEGEMTHVLGQLGADYQPLVGMQVGTTAHR